MERAHVLSASAASWFPSRGLREEVGVVKGSLSAMAVDWHPARDQASTGISLSASAVPWLPARSHKEAVEEGKGLPATRLQKVGSCMSCNASTPLPLWVQALKCKGGEKRRRRKKAVKAGVGQENAEEEAKKTSEIFSDNAARLAATVRLAINGAMLQLPRVKGAPLRRSVNVEGAVAVLAIVVEMRVLTKREMAYAAEKVVGLWTTELHVSAGRVEEKWARPNNSPVPFASDSAAVADELNVSISCLSLHPGLYAKKVRCSHPVEARGRMQRKKVKAGLTKKLATEARPHPSVKVYCIGRAAMARTKRASERASLSQPWRSCHRLDRRSLDKLDMCLNTSLVSWDPLSRFLIDDIAFMPHVTYHTETCYLRTDPHPLPYPNGTQRLDVEL